VTGKQRKHEARRRAQQQGAKPLPTHSAPPVVSLANAAGYLGIHSSTLRRWIQSGKIVPTEGGVAMDEIARVREQMESEAK
jgi:hypothetical protein